MRLKQYITEERDIVQLLQKDCMPYLQETYKSPAPLILYRGTNKYIPKIQTKNR